jgi:CHAT domain-containing protein
LDQQIPAEADIAAASALASQLASLPLQVEIAIALGDAQFPVDAGRAAESYRDALRLARESGEREEQSAAAAGLAKALERQGRLEDAASSIEDALKIVETSRGRLSSRELQVSYFSMRRSWYELAVDICMKLDRAHPGAGYAQLAFSYTERARARSLLDTLDTSGYSVTLPVAERVREAYARNQRETAAQQTLLASNNGRNRSEITEKLQQLYREQEGLESQMRSGDDKFASLLESQTATVEQVQRNLLDHQSAVVSYWIGEIHSYRWLITPDQVRVDVLPPRSALERVILPLENILQNRRPVPAAGGDVSDYLARQAAYEARLQRGLKSAGAMLLANLPEHANTLFVAGDGCLRSLPFAALRVADGGTTAYALRKYKIFLEPSASVALYLKLHPAIEQTPHIAIFADPVFSFSDSRVMAPKQAKATGHPFLAAHLERLTGSAEEARTISRYAPQGAVTLRVGFDASPDAVRSLSGDSMLHFATHTVSVAGHPEVTGIALSTLDRRGREQNGVFWLKDIYSLHLPLSLVVLSACNSGKVNDDNGEGLNNLSYAFFFAGAHSVVGSLWSVDDTTTDRLMDQFYYRLLVKQKQVPEALREAQLTMLANPQTKSPTVWASFVFEGWPAAYSFKQNIAEEHSSSPQDPR